MISRLTLQNNCLYFAGTKKRTNNIKAKNFSSDKDVFESSEKKTKTSPVLNGAKKAYNDVCSYVRDINSNIIARKERINGVLSDFDSDFDIAWNTFESSLNDYKENHKGFSAAKMFLDKKNPVYFDDYCPQYIRNLLGDNTYVFYEKEWVNFKFSRYRKRVNVPSGFAMGVKQSYDGRKSDIAKLFDFKNSCVYDGFKTRNRNKKAAQVHILDNYKCDEFPRFIKHFNSPMTLNSMKIISDDIVSAESMIVYEMRNESVTGAKVYINPIIKQSKYEALDPYSMPDCEICADSMYEFKKVPLKGFKLNSYMRDLCEKFESNNHNYTASDVLYGYDDKNQKCIYYSDFSFDDDIDNDEQYYCYDYKKKLKLS